MCGAFVGLGLFDEGGEMLSVDQRVRDKLCHSGFFSYVDFWQLEPLYT